MTVFISFSYTGQPVEIQFCSRLYKPNWIDLINRNFYLMCTAGLRYTSHEPIIYIALIIIYPIIIIIIIIIKVNII